MNKPALVFATNNTHKLAEVRAMLPHMDIVSLAEIQCKEAIPETAHTLEGNARLKADFIKERYGIDCFADDTGLEVEALNQAPGVYSARYAGPECDATANMRKLLKALADATDRKAQFRTVIALNFRGEQYLFEGCCPGDILQSATGSEGFGYDPIFRPDGSDKSFAEMNLQEKGRLSHRGKAVRKLVDFLHKQTW